MLLEKNFEVRKVMKDGKLSYMQVFPKNPKGKELFIYNDDNIDRQYILIDDERTSSFAMSTLKEAEENGVDVETFLLEALGEPVLEYFVTETDDGIFYYDDLKDIVDEYNIDVSVDSLYEVINAGCIIDTDDITIYTTEMTKIQFDAMEEVL